LTKEERERKRFDYFLLLRDADPKTAVTGKDISSARPEKTPDDRLAVDITLTKEGGERFFALTGASKGHLLAVVVDGRVITAPLIQAAVRDRVYLSGNYTQQERDDIIKALEADLKK
jgi:preprotein translocase subunit SecD